MRPAVVARQVRPLCLHAVHSSHGQKPGNRSVQPLPRVPPNCCSKRQGCRCQVHQVRELLPCNLEQHGHFVFIDAGGCRDDTTAMTPSLKGSSRAASRLPSPGSPLIAAATAFLLGRDQVPTPTYPAYRLGAARRRVVTAMDRIAPRSRVRSFESSWQRLSDVCAGSRRPLSPSQPGAFGPRPA